MFILCICANISYLGSILAHSTSWENIMHSLPYIVGAMTMPFDLTILYQVRWRLFLPHFLSPHKQQTVYTAFRLSPSRRCAGPR